MPLREEFAASGQWLFRWRSYLPVVLLTERARYGLFPGQGDVIPTGPNFVTRDQAQRVIELSRRSIR